MHAPELHGDASPLKALPSGYAQAIPFFRACYECVDDNSNHQVPRSVTASVQALSYRDQERPPSDHSRSTGGLLPATPQRRPQTMCVLQQEATAVITCRF